MKYNFDDRGWLTEIDNGRETDVTPPVHGAAPVAGQPWPNWTGHVWVIAPYSPPPSIPMADCKAIKIAAIRAHFSALVASVKSDAADYEVDTWLVQTAEYSAWIANNSTPVLYVAALATARGITVADLMAKIGVKVVGLATIQGTQHAKETAVNAATTNAEVDAVVI